MPAADEFMRGLGRSPHDTVPAPSPAPAFEDLQQAAEWFAVLHDSAVSDADRRRWQSWLDAGPRQRAAWHRVESISGEFSTLSGLPARRALERGTATAGRRRSMLRALALLPVAGFAGWMTSRHLPWQGWVAAHRTDTGERRELVLADGSRLWLNTATALDVDFSPSLRRIVLYKGEVLVTSGHDDASPLNPFRPLVVDVPQGRLTALGTRFAVRHEEGGAVQLAVFEGAVASRPSEGGESLTLVAGQQARLFADRVEAPEPVAGYAEDWTRGMLVADGMRLGDFIAELGRYRPGYLGCAPEVADLRIVGAYPLADPERILSALEATLPVRVRRPMPWWTVVEAAQDTQKR
ncbi:FecR domain-containing protein [Variovorax sp. RB3P1]|uniref:FecR domain-containing protein n=1 Tax=Variovorax sp. RB3P1 TaxID=3443732 RepID=UPI003F483E1C